MTVFESVLLTTTVPWLTVKPPVKVLAAVRASVPAPVLVSELGCALVPSLVPFFKTALMRRSVAAEPSATLNVTPVTSACPSAIAPFVPDAEMVEVTAPPLTVTVPFNPHEPKVALPPVVVSVPPFKFKGPSTLTKAPLLVSVPPALIVTGASGMAA